MFYKEINYGKRVAENESDELTFYFLETAYWDDLYSGNIDVFLGAKGSGKSALYLNLLNEAERLKENNIYVFKAENPRGDTIFSLFNQMTATKEYETPDKERLIEKDIVAFWKLYFLMIIATRLKEEAFEHPKLTRVLTVLHEAGLIPAQNDLKGIFTYAIHYIKQILTLQFFQPEVELDPYSGVITGLKGKISFDELPTQSIREGHFLLSDLFNFINKALEECDAHVWVAIDRLDVAFSEEFILEKRALKALFGVYNSLKIYSRIRIKIFLRDDIWMRILSEGLREASHIEYERLDWEKQDIFYLIMRRVTKNQALCQKLGFHSNSVLSDINLQKQLFYSLFPTKISNEKGEKIDTFDWIYEVLSDGNGNITPREVVHFLNEINRRQAVFQKQGNTNANQKIYSEKALKNSLKRVGKAKLTETLFAENSHFFKLVDFESAPAKIGLEWVKEKFGLDSNKDAQEFCRRYCGIGFLKELSTNTYQVVYLYRIALGLF